MTSSVNFFSAEFTICSVEVFLVPELPREGGELLFPSLDPQLTACVQAFRSSQSFKIRSTLR